MEHRTVPLPDDLQYATFRMKCRHLQTISVERGYDHAEMVAACNEIMCDDCTTIIVRSRDMTA